MILLSLYIFSKIKNLFQQDSINNDIVRHFEIVYNNQRKYDQEIKKLRKEIKQLRKDIEIENNPLYDLRVGTAL